MKSVSDLVQKEFEHYIDAVYDGNDRGEVSADTALQAMYDVLMSDEVKRSDLFYLGVSQALEQHKNLSAAYIHINREVSFIEARNRR